MKYAIISDIHSNLEALLAVLNELEQINPIEIISLGDVVGYGGSPNECIEILRNKSVTSIIGNHDRMAAGLEEPYNFNPVAREAALWTRSILSSENKEYIKSLPLNREYSSFFAVHGAISNPDKYIKGSADAEPEFGLMAEARVCFFGHTHVPAIYSNIATGNLKIGNKIELKSEVRYLINPGSVGQPRDQDPRASYAVYDTDGTIEFKRTEYDIALAQRKILHAGLPQELAQRLRYGY